MNKLSIVLAVSIDKRFVGEHVVFGVPFSHVKHAFKTCVATNKSSSNDDNNPNAIVRV